MSTLRKTVLMCGGALFGVWLLLNFGRITADQDGFVRFVLGLLFGVLILGRWKPDGERPAAPRGVAPLAAAAGALLAVGGIVFRVHQLEWLGVMALVFGCLAWSLPARYLPDILRAVVLLYWVHPLPSQVFGRFQILMQWLSVRLSEWALQVLNVRIWADGLILRTGAMQFGVPESCSGMRTAVTVLLSTLGLCLLLRLRWYELAAFLVIGVAQVLALNVVRIVAMVLASPRMPPEWAENFLHDTLGVFVLLSIVIVQLEAAWWKVSSTRRRRRREGIASGELDAPDRATKLPRFWRVAVRWGWVLPVGALTVGMPIYGFYKGRPAHRAEMIEGTVKGLIKTDVEAAGRAVDRVLAIRPGNREMLSSRAHVLLLRGEFAASLAALEALPPPLSIFEEMIRSWALMALDRGAEAVAALDALPASAQRLPGVAIVRAEYAAREGKPGDVAQHVVAAANWAPAADRVRALFPFLARHEQWRAIAASTGTAPYTDAGLALLAIEANLTVNDVTTAASLLSRALDRWPEDRRFLRSLYALARARPESGWRGQIERNVRANLLQFTADEAATYMKSSFELEWPDLAWLLYWRLRAVDPADPDLDLVVAEHADAWWLFRKRELGLAGGGVDEDVDLREFHQLTRAMRPFDGFWRLVPLADELPYGDSTAYRRRALERAIAELERRAAAGPLPARLALTWPMALATAGRFDDAHARLDDLNRTFPKWANDILLRHAMLYDMQARWQECYEALSAYESRVDVPSLQAEMLLVNALMNLNLGASAMAVVDRASRTFPGARPAVMSRAAVWSAFGFLDEALFTLQSGGLGERSAAVPQLLYDTGRYREALRVGEALRVPLRRDPLLESQPVRLPAAALAVRPGWPPPPAEAELKEAAAAMEASMQDAKSPFLRDLAGLVVRWYRSPDDPAASDMAAWERVARTDLERLAVHHRRAVLLGRARRYAEAAESARRALAIEPGSAIMHRLLIALTGGDAAVVEEARRRCPRDPEIWLAGLVVSDRAGRLAAVAGDEIAAAVDGKRFSPATMVRAGALLFEKGLREPAAAAARDAVERGQGLMPAYILALRCALQARDLRWALAVAMRAAQDARDPTPFYRVIVYVKQANQQADRDLFGSLEYLHQRFPDQVEWAEQLGHLYFQKRDTRRALSVLEKLVERNAATVRANSLLLAAEAARLEGDTAQAVRILETAHQIHPQDVDVLNNLIYCLAQLPTGVRRAQELLPALIEKAGGRQAILDTVAMVYMRNGHIDLARKYMELALANRPEGVSALEVQLNTAELLYWKGDYDEARQRLEALRRDPNITSHLDGEARRLLDRVDDARRRVKVAP